MIPSRLPVTAASQQPQPDARVTGHSVWDVITLLPDPAPEIALDQIDTRLRLAGRDCHLPLLLMSEHEPGDSEAVRRLARLAQQARLPLVAGDARVLLDNIAAAAALHRIRDLAPDVLLLGAIPATVLVAPRRQGARGVQGMREALIASGLDGLLIRLDFAQAALGQAPDLDASGTLETIAALVRHLRAPILVSCPAGISRQRARGLIERGVAGFVVGGAETFVARAANTTEPHLQAAFAGWGIPTLAAARMLRAVDGVVISDGQIDSGVDAAKALALGADLVTLAPTSDDMAALAAHVEAFALELRTTMFLTGAANLSAARQVPFVVTGAPREWLEAAESLWRTDARPG